MTLGTSDFQKKQSQGHKRSFELKNLEKGQITNINAALWKFSFCYINSDKLILLINEYLIINVDLDRGKTSCAWWRAMRSRFTRTRRAPKAARANHKSRSVSIYEYQKILKNRLIKSCSFKTPMEFPEILPVFFESFINFQTFSTAMTFGILKP